MNTVFLLLAQYDARTIIPIEDIARDFFSHLSPGVLARRLNEGTIGLPVIRIDPGSKKSAMSVHVQDLANYIDKRRAAAQKEMYQVTGVKP